MRVVFKAPGRTAPTGSPFDVRVDVHIVDLDDGRRRTFRPPEDQHLRDVLYLTGGEVALALEATHDARLHTIYRMPIESIPYDGDEWAGDSRRRVQCASSAIGATGVWVFGSLVDEDRAPGDVDLAVSGLAPEQYFRALAELMHLFGGPVDLVRLEEASETLRERIEQEGAAL